MSNCVCMDNRLIWLADLVHGPRVAASCHIVNRVKHRLRSPCEKQAHDSIVIYSVTKDSDHEVRLPVFSNTSFVHT